MITRLLRALRRRMLQSYITDMEDTVASIEKQRNNDLEALKYTRNELTVLRRQLQALVQEDINEATADNVRRMRR